MLLLLALSDNAAGRRALRVARVFCDRFERDAVAVGKELDRAEEVEALDLLDEADRVAARLTAEALVDALGGLTAERWGALGVERAQPRVGVGVDAAQLGARCDEVDHVDGVANLLQRLVGVAGHQIANALRADTSGVSHP